MRGNARLISRSEARRLAIQHQQDVDRLMAEERARGVVALDVPCETIFRVSDIVAERDAAIDIAVECFAIVSPLHLDAARAKVLEDIASRVAAKRGGAR